MKALFIGGTGVISSSVTALCLAKGWDVTLLNRGHSPLPAGVHGITADIRDEAAAAAALAGHRFDVVGQFVGYNAADAERDIRLFSGITGQYIFISSASAYQKPAVQWPVTESTPLINPYWQYSRDKAAAEQVLLRAFAEKGFPATIVRPSHTYCARKVPVGLHGDRGSWQVLQRIREEKPVLISGDGSSLWTLTWADDFAKGYVGLMANPHAAGNAFHITSDEHMSWDQIYGILADALGKPLHACHVASDFLAAAGRQYDLRGQMLGDKAVTVWFDNSKLRRAVPDFACTMPMAEGLRHCVDYALAHPETQTPDPDFDRWCDRVAAAQQAALEQVLQG